MKALSIRQPWAWLILHARKDIENRTWRTHYRGPVLIHAGQTMTRADYEAAAIFVAGIYDQLKTDFLIPEFEDLKAKCGGIVGRVEITDCVTQSASPWFCGEYGYVLQNPSALPFDKCKGKLGFFEI